MQIKTLPIFDKKLKSLTKKNPSLKKDFIEFIDDLRKNPKDAIYIKESVYKIRVKNSANNKGKSAGYRVYYFYKDTNGILVLLYIYTKQEFSNLPNEILDKLIKECKALV